MREKIKIIGEETGNAYTIEKKVNNGSFGQIYHARENGRDYALKLSHTGSDKLINKKTTPGYQGEAAASNPLDVEGELQSRVNHPHVVPIVIADKDQNVPFLVMPLANADLGEYLHRKPLSEEKLAKVCIQTADGLSRIHEEGVLHNDIKANNVLLFKKGGEFVSGITDFGNALSADEKHAGISTPIYAAPEQFTGKITKQSDQYRWAAGLLYPAVTRKAPYDIDYNDINLTSTDVYVPPHPKSFSLLLQRPTTAVEEAIESVATRAMKYHPYSRYPSMEEALDDLEIKIAKVRELNRKGRKSFS